MAWFRLSRRNTVDWSTFSCCCHGISLSAALNNNPGPHHRLRHHARPLRTRLRGGDVRRQERDRVQGQLHVRRSSSEEERVAQCDRKYSQIVS